MDLTLNEEQQMLQKMAHDFLEDKCPPLVVRRLEESELGYSPDMWREIADLGWVGLIFPEQYGGSELSLVDLTILYEEMGRAILPSPYTPTVLAGLTILACGSEEQKKEFLPKIINGESIFTLALLEPSASYDAAGIAVTAKASGDDYIINGTKLLVPNAHIADWLLCVTRTRGGKTPEGGITLFLVKPKNPGITVEPISTTALDKQFEVTFANVKVPKENMLGKLNGGWAPLARVLQQAAVLQSAEIVGMSQKVLEIAIDWAKSRVVYEQQIGVYQGIQHKLVNMFRNIEGARVMAWTAALVLGEGLPGTREVAVTKAWASQTAQLAGYEGHQVFAGQGYMQEHDMQLYSRRLKAAELNLGQADYHFEKFAQAIEM
ncbi:MAG: acyl-CoA/acyl-ACP dehydrogenase [Chloroflexi bacterium]|nr:acyl-CoA/acyl-ACP dehydrogenase [Chloroflexota bacterium]MBI3931710.1 acyl-CoA/acyl-ACP dehydrogenase [Chloroflexota bacterium]